jgi:REP element-mobilizing transposase RayT
MPREANHTPHSAYTIHYHHPYWGGQATLWAEGYSVGTAGHVSAQTIPRYIEESQQK